MATDTSERGLESLIVEAMTGVPGGVDSTQDRAHKPPTPHGGTAWPLCNASLRKRFDVDKRNKAAASRYIRETVEARMIKPFDEHAARKLMKYVPFWA